MMLRRLEFLLFAVGVLALAGCAPSPATPRAGEIEGLRARVQRSGGDTESALRLAAGLWAQGDRDAARRTLEQSRAREPDRAVYSAALGVVAEASGDYETARTLYMDFLQNTLQSSLAVDVAERVRAIRGEAAESLVRSLLSDGRTLNHGLGSSFVVALFPLRASGDDPELAALAAAATELLGVQLGSVEPFRVLDWETSEAALSALRPPTVPEADALSLPNVRREVAATLAVDHMVWGRLGRTAPDSVVFSISTYRPSSSGIPAIRTESLRASLASFPEDRVVASQLWAVLLGGILRTPPSYYIGDDSSASTDALLAMGEGLLLAEEGNRAGARARLDAALALAPDFPPLLERVEQLAGLDAFESSTNLPLADAILAHARMEAASDALLRDSQLALTPGSTRHGVGEALGLDHVGSQLFIDLVIQLGRIP